MIEKEIMRKVGEKINYNGVKLEVVEFTSCKNCFFYKCVVDSVCHRDKSITGRCIHNLMFIECKGDINKKDNQFHGLDGLCHFLDIQMAKMQKVMRVREKYSVGNFYKNDKGEKLYCFFIDGDRILFVKQYSCSIIEVLIKDIDNIIFEKYDEKKGE